MNKLNMILKQPYARDADRSTKSVFRQYWDKIEKAEKNYAGAQRQRDRIVRRFNDEMLSIEQLYCQENFLLIKKLVDFLDLKSLSKTDKLAVIDWAGDQISGLLSNPFRGNLDLEGVMKKLSAHENELADGPTEEELSSVREDIVQMLADSDIAMEDSDIDDILNASRKGPYSFFEELQKKAKHIHDQYYEKLSNEEFDFSKPVQPVDDELSAASLSKLYKRLAQRFHPDRAQNEQERHERHALMLQLTEAKRNQDVFAILNLVREYGDDDDAMFSDQQLDQWVAGLQQKLHEIRQKKSNLKTEGSVDALIYAKFHGRSNREIDFNFAVHKKMLETKLKALDQLLSELATAKQLKKHLSIRKRSSEFVFHLEELFV